MYSFEIEFHDSNLSSVAIRSGTLELHFDMAVLLVIDQFGTWLESEYHVIPATIYIDEAKYKKLPQVGCIYHGDLNCTEDGKSFVGTIPVDLNINANVIFSLMDCDGELEIAGSKFRIVGDIDKIPVRFRTK